MANWRAAFIFRTTNPSGGSVNLIRQMPCRNGRHSCQIETDKRESRGRAEPTRPELEIKSPERVRSKLRVTALMRHGPESDRGSSAWEKRTVRLRAV